jgi:hypothetical protein
MWTCAGLFHILALPMIKDHQVLAEYADTLLPAGVVSLLFPPVLPGT